MFFINLNNVVQDVITLFKTKKKNVNTLMTEKLSIVKNQQSKIKNQ